MDKEISIYKLIAYAIDFEGTIYTEKRILKSGSISFVANINIRNVSIELLKSFKNDVGFGNIIGPYKKSNEKHKFIYTWNMNRKEIREYLPLIQPYLVLKQRQAELVIEMLSILKEKTYSSKLTLQNRKEMYTWEEYLTLESIYQECRLLNKKGI